MDEKLLANYLIKKTEGTGLTYEIVAEKSNTPLPTVKNLYTGKTKDPRLTTVAPVIYAVNGSVDEMLLGESKEVSKQPQTNIITEQHFNDTIKHYEHRLEDKREIIKEEKEHNTTLKKEMRSHKIFSCICLGILVGILILEVLHPDLGWIRF